MIESLLNSTTIPLLQKVAEFGERRQEVLAGNIANINTPGYKVRDLPVAEFQEALKQAVEAGKRPRSPGHFSSQQLIGQLFPGRLFQAVEAPANNITFQDDGNRSIEHEIMKMTKNSMMQNFAIQLMAAQMDLLQTVISEHL